MLSSSKAESQVQNVTNFHDLLSTQFHGNINAICWSRKLVGNFAEIVDKVETDGNITTLGPKELDELKLSDEGKRARAIILEDMKMLEDHGASPILNVISSYDRDDSYPFFPTDVYSFHVDRSTVPSATFLCTYHGASSDILPNAQATQKIHIPEIRAELRKLYGGPDEGFEEFLSEYFFDLHYQAKPTAKPISLGLGHLWRLAIDHPGSKVLPCLHRAPKEKNGQKRLLLIC